MESFLKLHPLIEPMKTEQLTFLSTAPHLSLLDHSKMVYQSVIQLLTSFFRFLLVLDAPQLKSHRVLIRSLFLMYIIPCFIVLGMQAVLIMIAYQIGFKLLLRAVLYK